MVEPDYLICLDCETPVYVFEWRAGKASEVLCPVCGNEDPSNFATEDEMEEMSQPEDDEDED
ncbi:MAG: hypothetical protein ACHQQS_12085 [Thermoanaerobaculales bacterium]